MRGWLVTGMFIATCAVSASPVFAQKYQIVGRGKCVNCHDHDNEKLWSEKKDGPPPNNHLNALKQMESPKSKDFAKAVSVMDPYDVGSSCVRCHATVVKGDVSGGVTCETCHGPGSGYLDPHQKKDSYAQAVGLGMNDVVKKSAAWAKVCMGCHVMDDARLIAAKHPSGDDFDLGAKYGIVMTGHWKSNYANKAEISALGKAEAAKIIAARKGAAAPAVVAAPPPSAVPATAPPPPVAATAPSATTPPAPTVSTQAAAAKPQTPSASPPPPVRTSAPKPAAGPPAEQRTAANTPNATMTGLPTGPGRSAVTPDLGTNEASGALTPNAMATLMALLPQSPTAAVAAVQGRAIALVDSLIRRGGRAPLRIVPPDQKIQYTGPDAELLRLQNEVLSLALEALRTAPPAPADK